ncbi:MAG: glycoside hydrolase family 97 protein [Calditrichae bacterium]|nr:glycoside hydrolase family 97 protein [Calditrichia bacterium]
MLLFAACGSSEQVTSPDGQIKVTFLLKKGIPYYNAEYKGQRVISDSRLGFVLKDNPAFTSGFSLVKKSESTFDETWTQPWGEVKDIRNHYNEMMISLLGANEAELRIVFRIFNDGVGFRYEIPDQKSLSDFEILDELTEFNLSGDHKAWWIGAYQDNRYEYLYTSTPISEMDTVHTPLTMETADGLYLSIHEAALVDYASMTIASLPGNTLKADLVPWSDGVKVKTSAPMKTPWRTIQIAEKPGDLITSYLILNLNEPNKLGDTSWIEPGKYVGIWWEMHLDKSTWSQGPRHGATTQKTKKYMDFAAKYGFKGVLVEGWNIGWDGDWIKNGDKFSFTQAYDDFDIEAVTAYAANKDVGLIGHNETGGAVMNYEAQLTDGFKMYNSLGVKAVKTGYVNYARGIKRMDEKGEIQNEWHHGQHMVQHYQKVVDEAAKYHIMVDVHEPIKATGLRRTYPNMMTREGARGQEFNAWSADGGNPPEHETILPFTRLLGGPMDFTPGIFDLTYEKEKPNNRVNTTLAKQLAEYVVLYSPLQMAADLPENYEKNLKPFQFIRDVPCDWQDTRVLNATIGDYVTIVRKDRHSADWYLGSVSDENSRSLDITLDFLEPGKTYTAQIYRDADDADWKSNPYAIAIDETSVTNMSKLTLKLAAGGGTAIRFKIDN